ncbi:hypothetical protein [Sinomonas mesophila]|uniref:hypothetical protein n=1 Tax=Sinomonas mesophila TaxID=1531955 RepID=UPI0009870D1B|nr:hypothetical protein [Sinomonas mesophila]
MATTSQGKQPAEEAPQEPPQKSGQFPETVTITLPSLADLPPLPPVQIEAKRLAWWGGLAVLGMAGIVEWPVVFAVGAGSYVAERFAKDSMRKAASASASGQRPAAPPNTAQK